ncbi:MAG: hypothetical protein V9F01_14920 [Chitinophagaceae bacterium]
MIFKIKNRDGLLGVASIITFIIGAANALEYFFAGKDYLAVNKGVVTEVIHETYEGRRGRLYSKTIIRLNEKKGEFHLSDDAEDGGYISVEKGEDITIYARKWYQFLYNYDFRDNIYHVERNGEMVYNNLDRWKAAAFSYMCIFGGCALFLLVMYLDQAKNISIANWFQKRVINRK